MQTKCMVHGGTSWRGGYCDRWATDQGKGPCVHAVNHSCAICESEPGTVDAEWDGRYVKVCASCYEYETGEAAR